MYYEASDGPVFNNNARNVCYICERVATLQAKAQILGPAALWRVLHVITTSDKQIIQQIFKQ